MSALTEDRTAAMTIFYRLGDALYVNITNRCSCDCVFCIRNNGDAVGDASSLWLEREPTLPEIFADFAEQDLRSVREIVFCGYGEPLERADDVVSVCEFIKARTSVPVRLNTNGLVALINPDFDINKLAVFDAISVSLNSDNSSDYHRATRSCFGEAAFGAGRAFAQQCREFVPAVKLQFTVVAFSGWEGYWNEAKCRDISAKMAIPLRVRAYG
jgi:TatD family-associated radical SAM protein